MSPSKQEPWIESQIKDLRKAEMLIGEQRAGLEGLGTGNDSTYSLGDDATKSLKGLELNNYFDNKQVQENQTKASTTIQHLLQKGFRQADKPLLEELGNQLRSIRFQLGNDIEKRSKS